MDHIEKQIQAINKATQNASKSKESAIKFLTDAGIIKSSITEQIQEIIKQWEMGLDSTEAMNLISQILNK